VQLLASQGEFCSIGSVWVIKTIITSFTNILYPKLVLVFYRGKVGNISIYKPMWGRVLGEKHGF
jgi:hypothetical protein